jgi:osmotically-inducible protein OsmY
MTSHRTVRTLPRAEARSPWRLATALALSMAALAAGTGCAPLIVGGAMLGGGLVATDRRTTGTQVEDQAIELKAASRVRELATLGNVSVVSYNRMLLITGEVPGETEKATVGAALARIENVKTVVNELGIGQNASVGSRGTDTLIEAKVKAALVDAKDLHANAYKVVSERGIVYLMGRVSEREATRGAEVARAVGGVQKVVRVFEILSDEELANLGKTTAAPVSAPAPATPPR